MEYGCWIYLNTNTGRYQKDDFPAGSPCALVDRNSSGSIKIQSPINYSGTNNPNTKGIHAVANFHTHYPMVGAKDEASPRPTGASQADIDASNSYKMPFFVHDYVATLISNDPNELNLPTETTLCTNRTKRELNF